MQLAAIVGPALYVLMSWAVGVKLLRLWHRTREVPELAFGTCFLLGSVAFVVFASLGFLVEAAPKLLGPALATGFGLVCAASAAMYVATWRIFRAGSTVARGVAVAASAGLAIGWLGYLLAPALPEARSPWFWGTMTLAAPAAAWSGVEAFALSAVLRKRARIGLVGPEVARRVFFWGVGGIAGLVMMGAGFANHFVFGEQLLLPSMAILQATAGVVSALAIYAAFFPLPSWVAGRSGEARA